MKTYDPKEIREQVTVDQLFDLLQEWGGEPEYTSFGLIATTICHNPPGVGSRKLYYYENSKLFKCYTDCDSTFDIFELIIKVAKIQSNMIMSLSEAIQYLGYKLNIFIEEYQDDLTIGLLDWQYLNAYDKIKDIDIPLIQKIQLKTYNSNLVKRFSTFCHIQPWIKEGISEEAMKKANIGYCFSTDQIIIPHYNINNELVGLRGRTMCKEDAEHYGKYRPIYLNHTLYNHPLGMNLYNLNNSKENIYGLEKAILFESEKSCLLYQSLFGFTSDISVACCGSSLSTAQIQMLKEVGAKEIIVAFDRQFQEIGDSEFKRLTTKLINIDKKYGKEITISFIFDKNMITSYKASPIDEGKEKFLKLFKERIFLK